MKKKKIISILLTLAIAALFVWRMWPLSLKDVIGMDDTMYDTLVVQATEFGVTDGSLTLDVYQLESLSEDALHELINSAAFRPSFRNLLPWDITAVDSGSSNITQSANLTFIDSANHRVCHVSFHGSNRVSVDVPEKSGFLIYYPTDHTLLSQVVSHVKEHGVPLE
ncbi:MAG: hypothetical protein ACI4EG_03200 [Fusicatenibacter sp.]